MLPSVAVSYWSISRPWSRSCRHPSETPTKPAERERNGGLPSMAKFVPPPTAHRMSCPLYFTKLAVVVRPRVDEVRREQGEHAQPCLGGIFEANVQNNRIAARVRDHAIDHSESPAAMRARRAESGNPVFDST